jgi:hypothetical protein
MAAIEYSRIDILPGNGLAAVIASAAKQSIVPQAGYGLLRRFAPRNDEPSLVFPGQLAAATGERQSPRVYTKN